MFPQIVRAVRRANPDFLVDQHAGEGHLLRQGYEKTGVRGIGFDINEYASPDNKVLDTLDPESWSRIMSILRDNGVKKPMIFTNPPYLQYAARTQKDELTDNLKSHFPNPWGWDNLYKISLQLGLDNIDDAMYIVPKASVREKTPHWDKLNSLTYVTDPPFGNTKQGVVMHVYDGIPKEDYKVPIYVDGKKFKHNLGEMNDIVADIDNEGKNVNFNQKGGWLLANRIQNSEKTPIGVNYPDKFKQMSKTPANTYKHFVDADIPVGKRDDFISDVNTAIDKFREDYKDIPLSNIRGKDVIRIPTLKGIIAKVLRDYQ